MLITKELDLKNYEQAPDGSRVYLLSRGDRGSMCLCYLPAGCKSKAVKHKTVEEVWYVIEGKGEIWRKLGSKGENTALHPGISLTIPKDTSFQFRNTFLDTLKILIITMPPWPGNEEATRVQGIWEDT